MRWLALFAWFGRKCSSINKQRLIYPICAWNFGKDGQPCSKILVNSVLFRHRKFQHQFSSDQHGWAGNHVLLQKFFPAYFFRYMKYMGNGHSIIFDKSRSCEQKRSIRMFSQNWHLPFQLLRSPQIVTVQKRDPLTPRLSDTIISGCRRTGIVPVLKNSYSVIFLCKCLHPQPGCILWTVINDQQFPVFETLCKNTVYCLF